MDFTSCLGPGLLRLSPISLATLILAWRLRDVDELRGRDLLRALIAISNQLEDKNVHSLLGQLRPANRLVDSLTNRVARAELGDPVLAADTYRVLDVALREAGPEGLVTNLDLLIGLAEVGQELLVAEGITADEIRRAWAS